MIINKADFDEIKRLQQERNALKGKSGSKAFDPSTQRTDSSTKVSLTDTFDTTLYDRASNDKFAGYNTSIPVNDEDEDVDMDGGDRSRRLVGQYTASKEMLNEFANAGEEDMDLMSARAKGGQIADRETDYQKRRFQRQLTPTRKDAFSGDGGGEGRSYREVMLEKELEREEERVRRKIEEKLKNGDGQMDGVEHEAILKEKEADQDSRDGSSDGTRKRVCLIFILQFLFFEERGLTETLTEEEMGCRR